MNRVNIQLRNLEVLIFDCQATNSDPSRGDVFDIGWLAAEAREPSSQSELEARTESLLVRTLRSESIPRYIQKITGLETEDFSNSLDPKEIWLKLLKAAERTASKNRIPSCPTVIHFARYEEPFLRSFHRDYSPKSEFPFQILCTHEIVRRLVPGLPRKGLRTTAGYFGYSIPDIRRSRAHVAGTFLIWKHAVGLLAENEGITNFQDLMDWLNVPFPATHKNLRREFPMAEKFKKHLPDCPGIYRMYRSNGDILYVGKAKSLRSRVNSYFQKKGKHSEHILDMLSQAKSLTHSVTKTPLEAALKESDEIKALAPPFNIALRASEEGPFFFSSDLKSCSDRPDPQHRIGPLTTKRYIQSLAAISDILNNASDPVSSETMKMALATPDENLPGKEVFLKGMEAFKFDTEGALKFPARYQTLMRLGSYLWKERLEKIAEKAREETEEANTLVLKPEPPETEKKSREINWSPEKISKRLRHMIRVGTYLIRRARWYYMLTESSIAWMEGGTSAQTRNLTIIQNGRPYFKEPIPVYEDIPVPPGYRKSNLEKQRNFDLFTYDRMGILTTEIRKMKKDDISVEVRFGLESSLRSDQLERLLLWI